MSDEIKNHDTILLLQECGSGCKMAIETMDDIREHVDDKQLRELIDKHYDIHVKLRVDCRDLLERAGGDMKEPGMIARASAKIQTQVKMLINDDRAQAAKLLTEGCNMGVETLSSCINKYKNADDKSKAIANRLKEAEETMVGDLQPLL